mmetsp:Transcript_78435/g.139052  ORF Transcript_78435/g.139052 Transcript_78435/m.139052 type:complete len:90 (-) Transcript_78435:1451-1720(-)
MHLDAPPQLLYLKSAPTEDSIRSSSQVEFRGLVEEGQKSKGIRSIPANWLSFLESQLAFEAYLAACISRTSGLTVYAEDPERNFAWCSF